MSKKEKKGKVDAEKKSTIDVGEMKKKSEALVKGATTEISDANLIELARSIYKRIYQSWLDFALCIFEIKKKEIWKKEHEDMKSFCEENFPDMSYSVIVKLLAVAEDWGLAIHMMKKKKPDMVLPAYSTCYELTAHKEYIKEDELARLRKDILERKLYLGGLQERLKEIVKKRDEKSAKKEFKEDKKIERKLEKMERDEDNEEFEIEEEELDGEVENSLDSQAKERIPHADDLLSNLPVLTSAMKSTTKGIVDLAEKLEKLEDVIGDYLTKASKCSEE
jgi:hypothetical protein